MKLGEVNVKLLIKSLFKLTFDRDEALVILFKLGFVQLAILFVNILSVVLNAGSNRHRQGLLVLEANLLVQGIFACRAPVSGIV